MRNTLALGSILALFFVAPGASADGRAGLPELEACLGGPDIQTDPACVAMFDSDADADVDLGDVARFQRDYCGVDPRGACCFADLSCALLSETECLAAGGGGEWLGACTDCGECFTFLIQSVTYGGSGVRTVKVDCPYPPCSNYSSPQWLDANHDGDADDAGDHAYPVAYVRNNYVVLSGVSFHVTPSGLEASDVPVRGTGPDGLVFEGLGSVSGETLTVPGLLTSSTPLANTVRYYASFAIDWEVALDGAHYHGAGTSGNRLCVTYAAPLGDRLESYFVISTQAADGMSAEQETIDAIWTAFADREVYNAYGERLAYYRDVLCAAYCTYYSAPELVFYTTSQCGGWADLLIQCLRTQGIGGAQFITIEPMGSVLPPDCGNPPSSGAGFLVKNYSFVLVPPTPCPAYAYPFNDPCGYYTAWASPGCIDAPGLPGQDNPNPASWFARHFIVKINLKYYDPSYGAGPFTGTKDEANLAWEQGAIAGYFGVAVPSPARLGVRRDVVAIRETNFDQ